MYLATRVGVETYIHQHFGLGDTFGCSCSYTPKLMRAVAILWTLHQPFLQYLYAAKFGQICTLREEKIGIVLGCYARYFCGC